MLTHREFRAATGEDAGIAFEVDALDVTSGESAERIMSFLDDVAYLEDALQNPRLVALLTTPAIESATEWPDRIQVLAVQDPRWAFYMLSNYDVANRPKPPESVVDESATVSPLAFIAERGVRVGPGCVVEPFAALYEGVTLDQGVIVRSHTVIGDIGFEHKRTSRGVLSVLHDGGVAIGARTEIGAHCNIAQGFLRRQTVIGADVRIDSMTHLAHGCLVGDEVFIAAGVTLSGSVTVGRAVWIGPGAVISNQVTIGDNARVAIGSLVLRNVTANTRVAGNPARAQP
jgi:UDP-3-O-[3-hydroxymyristoyl] glucosamine N-acyltransferase